MKSTDSLVTANVALFTAVVLVVCRIQLDSEHAQCGEKNIFFICNS